MGPSLCSHSVPAELLKQGVLPRASLTSSAQESPGGLPTGPGSQRLFLPQLQQETLRLSLHTQHAPGLLDSQSLRQKKSVILSCLVRQISPILPLPNCCSSHTYHCPQRWLQCGPRYPGLQQGYILELGQPRCLCLYETTVHVGPLRSELSQVRVVPEHFEGKPQGTLGLIGTGEMNPTRN